MLEHTREPRAIYERLAQDPDLFVELVCCAYRAKGDTGPRQAGEQRRREHCNAGWSCEPGDGYRAPERTDQSTPPP